MGVQSILKIRGIKKAVASLAHILRMSSTSGLYLLYS